MLVRLKSDPALQEMLTLREECLQNFKSKGITEQKEDACSALVRLVDQDTIPKDFRIMLAKLNAVIEITKTVESDLNTVKDAEKEYLRSQQEEKANMQKIKLDSMNACLDTYDESWGRLIESVPLPTFNLKDINSLSKKLKELNQNSDATKDFLKFYNNEKRLNDYLLEAVKAKLIILEGLKKKIKTLCAENKLVINSTNKLNILFAMKANDRLQEEREAIFLSGQGASPSKNSLSKAMASHGIYKQSDLAMEEKYVRTLPTVVKEEPEENSGCCLIM